MKLRPHLNVGNWQLMWWGRWIGVGSFGPWGPASFNRPIYDIRIGLGFAELRRFA